MQENWQLVLERQRKRGCVHNPLLYCWITECMGTYPLPHNNLPPPPLTYTENTMTVYTAQRHSHVIRNSRDALFVLSDWIGLYLNSANSSTSLNESRVSVCVYLSQYACVCGCLCTAVK